MAVTATIDIKLNSKLGNFSRINIIHAFINYGWSLNDNGRISYLPINDNDEYNWQNDKLNEQEIFRILSAKEKNNEIIGIVMTWENLNIGGNLLVFESGNISFIISINRKLIDSRENCVFTDVNWYLDKLIPALEKEKFQIESLCFNEYV